MRQNADLSHNLEVTTVTLIYDGHHDIQITSFQMICCVVCLFFIFRESIIEMNLWTCLRLFQKFKQKRVLKISKISTLSHVKWNINLTLSCLFLKPILILKQTA